MVEHSNGGAQSHAHLRANVSGRPWRGGCPPARLGYDLAAVAAVRRVFVQSEGVAVNLGGEELPQPTHDSRHTPDATSVELTTFLTRQ